MRRGRAEAAFRPGVVPAAALRRAAELFRTFGEEYHEKKLEEAHIFPVVRKVAGPAATYPDVLVVQHERGREITDYVLTMTRGAKPGAASGSTLAEMGELFEQIERQQFGHDGFEDAVQQVGEIEGALDIADIAQFTPAPPPHAG